MDHFISCLINFLVTQITRIYTDPKVRARIPPAKSQQTDIKEDRCRLVLALSNIKDIHRSRKVLKSFTLAKEVRLDKLNIIHGDDNYMEHFPVSTAPQGYRRSETNEHVRRENWRKVTLLPSIQLSLSPQEGVQQGCGKSNQKYLR